jgi:hypothetical protein
LYKTSPDAKSTILFTNRPNTIYDEGWMAVHTY